MRRISKILFLAMLVISLMFFSRTSLIFAATEKIDAGDYSDYQEIDDETNKASTPSAVTNNTTNNNANTNINTNKANNNSNNNTANKNSNSNSNSNIANTATTSHPQTGIYNTSVCVAIATVVVSFIVVSYIKLKKYNY